MKLTFEKLIQFDLIEDIEAGLGKEEIGTLMAFLKVCQEIQNVDQFIKDLPSYPGSMDKIERSERVSSIGATLAIEGIKLTTEEIEAALEKRNLDTELEKSDQETLNTQFAYEYVISLLSSKPPDKFVYTEDHIKEIHKRLTSNIDYGLNVPGQYREVNPIYGVPPRRSLCRTKGEVENAMSRFVEWLNTEDSGPVSSIRMAKAIMAHYYLAEIHPFGDGNGRTARALEALILYEARINTYCFWSLANFWSANRNEYIIHLANIRSTCNPWELLIWGLKGYLKEVQRIKADVLKKVKQLMLMDYVRWLNETKKLQEPEKKINSRIVGILEFLTHCDDVPLAKFVASPQVKTLYYRLSSQTRYRDFDKMSKLKLTRTYQKDGEEYIGPNYPLLEYLQYNI